MAHTCSRARKFTCFALGVALPLAGFLLWKGSRCCGGRKRNREEQRDETIEESFPASDPPSSW